MAEAMPFMKERLIRVPLEDREADGVADAEDVEVFQIALHDIDQAIISVGIGRHHEEAGTEDVVAGVADEAFDLLFILEANADPETWLDGCMLMEM